MEVILLLILAMVPGVVLLYFILFMDRNEREPLGLVLKIMLLGALSVVPAAVIEVSLKYLPVYGNGKVVDALVIAFIQVAWVEELCKLGVVLLFAWKKKEFNEENDGIVYMGASALGFAMLENVFYVLDSGIGTGILRALTAIPLHCFTGVLMGYYVGLAKMSPDKKTRRRYILKGFLLAYLLHGVYDALLLTQTPAAILIFPMVVWLVIFGIKFLKKGRALSLARAAAAREAGVTPDAAAVRTQELLVHTNPKNQLWKIIISRVLLTLSGVFWGLVLLGFILRFEQLKSQALDVIFGSIILSFVPILIGVILEISYRRKKKIFRELREKIPEAMEAPEIRQVLMPPEPDSTPTYTYPYAAAYASSAKVVSASDLVSSVLEASPPGQMWRIIVSRTFLTLIALFWALVILAFLSNIREFVTQLHLIITAGIAVSFFPVYTAVFLEDSYRKRKKRFNEIRESLPKQAGLPVLPGKGIPAEVLALSPPGQVWKILISRTLFGISALFLILLLGGGMFVKKVSPEEFFQGLMGGAILTAVPVLIGVLLESSFRKNRGKFTLTQQDTIAAFTQSVMADPWMPADSDEDLHAYCRKIKDKRQGGSF